jgi:hypothetical protein
MNSLVRPDLLQLLISKRGKERNILENAVSAVLEVGTASRFDTSLCA